MKMTIIVDQLDSHTHFRLFINGGLSGNLTMRVEEFNEFIKPFGNSNNIELTVKVEC